MKIEPLLPDRGVLRCEQVSIGSEVIIITVCSAAAGSHCPGCGQLSARRHSRYMRTLSDLPWHGIKVQLRWRSRRFFCDHADCPRHIFTEHLPQVAAPHGRMTTRMSTALACIAFACGGEPGSRLAERLGLATSPDRLLRLVRRANPPSAPTPRVLGVDDWALRRGQRYGTILCDLEQHRPIDLLPQRSSKAFSTWLEDHPGVQIISRDRGDDYIKGATTGAPKATQVADRWHLVHNLHESLVRTANRYHQEVAQAAKIASIEVRSPAAVSGDVPAERSEPGKMTCAQQRKQTKRDRRLRGFERVTQLHRQGKTQRAIARELGMHRGTVRRFIRAGRFPERAARQYHGQLDRFATELRKRWDEGCHNAVQLTRELQTKDARVSYHMVRRCVASWRQTKNTDNTRGSNPTLIASSIRRPSSRRVAWILMKQHDELEPEEQVLGDAMTACCSALKSAMILAHEFTRIVRDRCADDLDAWIDLASGGDAPEDLRSFARGLASDHAAVSAALTLPWSNGQVEGQVNRLKLLKRQMYGRANFDLLRARFLHAG